MEVLAERFHGDAKPDVTIETPEKDFVLDVYAGSPLAEGHNVIVYSRVPSRLSAEPYADEVLYNKEAEAEDFHADGSFVRNVGVFSSLDAFKNVKKLPNLRRALGYRWTMQQLVEGDAYHRWTEFAYPSVEQLNSFLDEVSPGEGIRYRRYQGGRYSAVELAEALVAGQVLVAEELDYQLHDHAAAHVLGALGLHGGYLEHRQEFIRPYLARYKAELELPEIPGQEAETARNFLYPSHEILKTFDISFDRLTADLGDAVFSVSPYRYNDTQLVSTLEAASYLGRDGNIPRQLQPRGGPKLSVVGGAILERFERFEEAAREMLGEQAA